MRLTMAATNFKTENNTFRKLIGNGLTYHIPRFQRDYSWELDQWEDLWADILSCLNQQDLSNTEQSHYMGYLVLQSSDDKHFEVIDGQQRLTTLSLIVLAILKNIKRLTLDGTDKENDEKRLNQIMQTYIGYLDPVTLVSRPKLTLNKNNNSYYQTYIIPLGDRLPQRGFRASEHLLRKAFEWFDKQISTYVKSRAEDKGRELAQLVESISDKLFFTVITVTDELNAYKVFETLNARGVQLSSTDLLKNYLFSVLDTGHETEHELQSLETRWESLVNRLQAEKFPDFLRIHWNSRNKFTRHADLFKTIRNNVKHREHVFALIRGMEEDLEHYLALSSPEISQWNREDKERAIILKMFRVKQPYSLLLAARRKFSQADFTSLFRAIVQVSFRYNTIGAYSPNDQEVRYNEITEKINNGEIERLQQLWPLLKPVYIDDERFKYDFAEKSFGTSDTRQKKIVRYILCELERQISNNDYEFDSDVFNIEHVLPQNAPDHWGGFTNEEANALVSRLGNMTLLKASENRDIGIEPYEQKRAIYQQSNFVLTKTLADKYSEWNAEQILSWQNWMAKQATVIWGISQLS